ncbi:MAG TPA: hypothetical protein VE093_37570, partial [Polyangiaceae bacterium]|nr:hypothetical protein [Polyangiaceae bacterium]
MKPVSSPVLFLLPLAFTLAGCSDPEPERPNAFGRVDGAALQIQSYSLTLNDTATQLPYLDARLKVSCDEAEPR